MTYNIPRHRRGDTWDGINKIGIKVNGEPVDLSETEIVMEFREDYDSPVALRLSTVSGNIIVLPDLSSIQVLPVLIDVPPATYKYDLQVTYITDPPSIKTYLEGAWEIYYDITV
jgi:hypothetical protein